MTSSHARHRTRLQAAVIHSRAFRKQSRRRASPWVGEGAQGNRTAVKKRRGLARETEGGHVYVITAGAFGSQVRGTDASLR